MIFLRNEIIKPYFYTNFKDYMRKEAVLELLVKKIKEEIPEVSAIYLFGSQADGTANKESDFDLGILLPDGKKVEPLRLFNLTLDLAVAIDQDVDLIDLNAATTVLAFQIIMKGSVIFMTNELYLNNFEVTIMSMYQRLNEERKDYLEEIARTGRILS